MPKKYSLKENFTYQPMLFLLLPIALCVLASFPGWSEGRFAIVSYVGENPVEAGSVSLYEAFNQVGGLCAIMFSLSLGLSISVAIYGCIAAFFPKLRGAVSFFVPVLCALTFAMASGVWGHVLLGYRIDMITTDYFLSIDQTVTKSHALTRTTLTFLLSGLIPFLVWIWWIWAFILRFRIRAKAKRTPAQ